MRDMITGRDLINRAKQNLGDDYVLGATWPLNKSGCHVFDCSLAASYWFYQVAGIVYGCIGSDPATADPYTGAWGDDAQSRGRMVSIEQAAVIEGAYLLRLGQRIGHIVLVQKGRMTVEAAGAAYGVIEGNVDGRRWTMGVLPPGIHYDIPFPGQVVTHPTIYRLDDPLMRGNEVLDIQKALLQAGFGPGNLDGIYGHETVNAVLQYQKAKGLIPDGEVGPQTLKSLGVI